MRPATLMLALLLLAASLAPALAQMCDTRCDEGEVWSDKLETCIDTPKPMS